MPAVFTFTSAARIAIFTGVGLFNTDVLSAAAALLLVMALGLWCGHRLHGRLTRDQAMRAGAGLHVRKQRSEAGGVAGELVAHGGERGAHQGGAIVKGVDPDALREDGAVELGDALLDRDLDIFHRCSCRLEATKNQQPMTNNR